MAPMAQRCGGLALLLLAAVPAVASAQGQQGQQGQQVPLGCLFYGWRFHPAMAQPLRNVSDALVCQMSCQDAIGCKYFGYSPLYRSCWHGNDSALPVEDELFVAGPAQCEGGTLSPECSDMPGASFPGPTALASQQAWNSGITPLNLQCWPRTQSGGIGQCGDPITVLEDAKAGWPGQCMGLTQVALEEDDSCQQSCERNVTCASWQELEMGDGTSSCWQGVGYRCWANRTMPAGETITAAQRFMRGHYRVLKNLTGYVVTNLKFAFSADRFGTDIRDATLACNHTCLSLLTCQVWQYSVQSGCYFHDPDFAKLQYPPTTSSMSNSVQGAEAVVAGEYIQRLCSEPLLASPPIPQGAPVTTMAPVPTIAPVAVIATVAPLATVGPLTTMPLPTVGPLPTVAPLATVAPVAAVAPGSVLAPMPTGLGVAVGEAAPGTLAPETATTGAPLPVVVTVTEATIATAASTTAATYPPTSTTESTQPATTAVSTTAPAVTLPTTTEITVLPPTKDRFIEDITTHQLYFQDLETETIHLVRAGCAACGTPPPCNDPTQVTTQYVTAIIQGEDFECSMLEGGSVQVETDFQPMSTLTTTATSPPGFLPAAAAATMVTTSTIPEASASSSSGGGWPAWLWGLLIVIPCCVAMGAIGFTMQRKGGKARRKRGHDIEPSEAMDDMTPLMAPVASSPLPSGPMVPPMTGPPMPVGQPAMMTSMSQAQMGMPARPPMFMPRAPQSMGYAAMFNQLDANHDGVISAQEFAGMQAMQQQFMQAPPSMQPVMQASPSMQPLMQASPSMQPMAQAAHSQLPEGYDLVTVTPHGLEVTPLGGSPVPAGVPILETSPSYGGRYG